MVVDCLLGRVVVPLIDGIGAEDILLSMVVVVVVVVEDVGNFGKPRLVALANVSFNEVGVDGDGD